MLRFNSSVGVAVKNSKEGCFISHYDFVLLPDGRKQKIYSGPTFDETIRNL